MPLSGLKIGCIGGGAMAEAIITGLSGSGIAPAGDLYVTDIREDRLGYLHNKLSVNVTRDNGYVAGVADIILVALKPHVVGGVLREIAGFMKPGQTLISIAAGLTTGMLEGYLNIPAAVVRVMPNTPALVGAGASAVCRGSHAGPADLQRALAIFNAVGRAIEVPESLMDAVTGLSGSGPAYMFVILEAMADAGVRVGLPRDVATMLAAQTMLGSARMLLETGGHPAGMKDMVTTPGGTTIEGLYALEQEGLRGALMRAVEAATRRAREMAGGLK